MPVLKISLRRLANFMSWCIIENDMDGDAIVLGLASCPGPDWLKEIIPKVGQRFKVYRLLSSLCTDTEL